MNLTNKNIINFLKATRSPVLAALGLSAGGAASSLDLGGYARRFYFTKSFTENTTNVDFFKIKAHFPDSGTRQPIQIVIFFGSASNDLGWGRTQIYTTTFFRYFSASLRAASTDITGTFSGAPQLVTPSLALVSNTGEITYRVTTADNGTGTSMPAWAQVFVTFETQNQTVEGEQL